jgi:hypothetical protein
MKRPCFLLGVGGSWVNIHVKLDYLINSHKIENYDVL